MSGIAVRISGTVHYVSRWRAAWSVLTGRSSRTWCGRRMGPRRPGPAGVPCVPCAVRAGERSL